jgi:hypothetical protein
MRACGDQTAEFSVYWFDPQDFSHAQLCGVDAKTAVEMARDLTLRPAAQIGIIRRVIITDGGDNTCFEWKYLEGITFGT